MQRPENEKYILPFIINSLKNNQDFNKDTERATIFCLTEIEREKGGGFIRKTPPEKILYIDEICHPFWIAPFNGSSVLIDGLNISAHNMTQEIIPNLKEFLEKMNINTASRQAYISFLSDNINYFQIPNEEKKIILEGLITDQNFLTEFLEYFKHANSINQSILDCVLVSPAKSKSDIKTQMKEMENLRLKFQSEVTLLGDIIKNLNKKTTESLKLLSKEKEKINDEFNSKIAEEKIKVEKIKSQLHKKYSEKVTSISQQYDQEKLLFKKEIIALTKKKEQIDEEIEHTEGEIRTSAINKDEVTEQKWKEKRTELKKELPDVERSIKELERKAIESEEKKKEESFKLKTENDDKIKDSEKNLIGLETSKEAEIKVLDEEMERIDDLTKKIIEQADHIARMREAKVNEFEELGFTQKVDQPLLVYMPFYLSCYQSKEKRRYKIFSPSKLNEASIGLKLKTMGKAKITQLLEPLSKKIVFKLNKFAILMDENVVFSREITEACGRTNLIKEDKTKLSIEKGLNQLEKDEWISQEEYENFRKSLSP